eukprot:scaffold10741_cov44-Phaeocystis_antarctica.AAC.2
MLAASSLQYTHLLEVSVFSSPGKFRASREQVARSGSDLELHTWRTHQPRLTSCDPCCSRALPTGRRPCSFAVMRAS